MLGVHITGEGELVRNGINFYPLRDKSSFGFKLRCGAKVFWLRYSKRANRFFIGLGNIGCVTREKNNG